MNLRRRRVGGQPFLFTFRNALLQKASRYVIKIASDPIMFGDHAHASVRARLLNIAKAQGVDFNQVLIRFALERILYRMSQSAHADRFPPVSDYLSGVF